MGHWGWRPMVAVFMSVWVVACAPTQTNAPTIPPTDLPLVTLIAHLPTAPTPRLQPTTAFAVPIAGTPTPIVYTVQPGDTLLQISRRFGVPLADISLSNVMGGIEPLKLQIGAELLINNAQFDINGLPIHPTEAPPFLFLSPPACSPAPTNYILCLGEVMNPFDHAIQRVSVLVNLLQGDGALLTQGETAVEQAIIPPGAYAPYRLMVKADWRVFTGATARLQTAEPAPAEQFVAIEVESLEVDLTDHRYTLRGQFYNASDAPAHLFRAVLTLWNADGGINTYRVVQFDGILEAGGRMPFEIGVMAGSAAMVESHSLYIEAVRAS